MKAPFSRREVLCASLAAGAALLLPACETARRPVPGSLGNSPAGHVFRVTSNHWHSEVVLSAELLPEGAIPETADFPQAHSYAFGWGDADYYQTPDPGIGITLRAAFTPTPAVMHLVGLPAAPEDTFAEAEVLKLKITDAGLERLIAFLNASFARKGSARAQAAGPGLYSFSRFYAAKGEFHLFNTCNSWTARAIAAAGLPVNTGGMQRAEDLLAQLRPLADR